MRLLFAKHTLAWPRVSGHDVHAFHMMQACASLGHDVSLATVVPPSGDAVARLPLVSYSHLDTATNESAQSGGGDHVTPRLTWLQGRFRSYHGIPVERLTNLRAAANRARADAVIVVGLDGLPYFGGLNKVVRVWYAADEWIWHHLSLLRWGDERFGENLRYAAIKGAYERAHARLVDRVWVVSAGERRAMRWLAGMRAVDVVPNGVDAEFFRPADEPEEPRTAVFWGRLDFEPNLQALDWFLSRVWPLVSRETADARFTIVGFRPPPAILRLHGISGITVLGDVPDLRPTVRRQALVVLPFVSGGGLKNKLLEAAALQKPIICTPRALGGLRNVRQASLIVARSPERWSRLILDLWADERRRRELGAAARAWVLEHHTWVAAARDAIAGIERTRNGT